MDGCLVSLQVGWAGEALAAVVAGIWFGGPNVVQLDLISLFFSNWNVPGDGLLGDVNGGEHGLLNWH